MGDARDAGAVQVEYLQVLILVTLGMAAAVVPLGLHLLRHFDVLDALIGLPIP